MSESGSKSNRPSIFVTTVNIEIADKLLQDLINQGFETSTPLYTIFSAKKKNLSCTLYKSGKLTVQGKETESFIEFYLEPEILKTFDFKYEKESPLIDISPHIGIDESGKGDFFGPLCIAGVFAEGAAIADLKTIGVQDSKNISDIAIIKIGNKIKANYVHHIVKINPLKYNELYDQFKNLNLLLAWGHATVIEQLVIRTKCTNIVIDQFAAENVVVTALKRKKLEVSLTQRHRAEADLVVAAASILARQTFLEGLEQLGEQFSIDLPKGASSKTIAVGRNLVAKFGRESLNQVGKLHFKTLDSILGKESEYR